MLSSSQASGKSNAAAALDQASLVSLFAQYGQDANLLFLTSRASDAEQRRHFYDLRAEISGSIFDVKSEGVYLGMAALLGDQKLDMLSTIQNRP